MMLLLLFLRELAEEDGGERAHALNGCESLCLSSLRRAQGPWRRVAFEYCCQELESTTSRKKVRGDGGERQSYFECIVLELEYMYEGAARNRN